MPAQIRRYQRCARFAKLRGKFSVVATVPAQPLHTDNNSLWFRRGPGAHKDAGAVARADFYFDCFHLGR